MYLSTFHEEDTYTFHKWRVTICIRSCYKTMWKSLRPQPTNWCLLKQCNNIVSVVVLQSCFVGDCCTLHLHSVIVDDTSVNKMAMKKKFRERMRRVEALSTVVLALMLVCCWCATRKKWMWVKPWVEKRLAHGAFINLLVELAIENKETHICIYSK